MIYPWGHKRRFNSYTEYFRKHFNERVQKLTLNAGFTCPNRDGTISTGGCTYCNNSAFNPSYCNPQKSITTQLKEGIEFHKVRYRRANQYLAYFQAYSNTHAPLEKLKILYSEALTYPGVIGLVIGTRPDCVDDKILDYIGELAQKYYIVIEYGVESCNNDVLEAVNKGHSFEQSVLAIKETAKREIKTGAHFIIGLPGETNNDFIKNIDIVNQLPLHTIKFHQLQVIKGTQMQQEYLENPGKFHFYNLDEYLDLIVDITERLNPLFVIERIAAEVPPNYLAGPGWGQLRIYQIMNLFEKKLEKRNTWQGRISLKQQRSNV
jgi:hypothetical protein